MTWGFAEVSECVYWLEDENGQWCEMAGRRCACLGNEAGCSVLGRQVTTAIKAEQRAVAYEADLRAKRKRMRSLYERQAN